MCYINLHLTLTLERQSEKRRSNKNGAKNTVEKVVAERQM